jgi:uncharacterized membrane protein YfhO
MKKKIVTVTTLSITVYTETVLMLSTAIIYFVAASESYSEISQAASQSSVNKDALEEIMGTTNEMIFFMIVGIAYLLVGFWIIKRKYRSKVPYVVAIVGPAALIVFYIATRTISLPTIGLQTDIGTIDTAAKILQGLIIAGSLFVLGSSKRFAIINR